MNEGAHIETGGNIAVNIGGNLTDRPVATVPEPDLAVQNTNGQIDNGGNLTHRDRQHSTQGKLRSSQNYDEQLTRPGHIGTGGNIYVAIGGNLTANS